MATWSLCTKFGSEQQKQKVFINLDNVITVEGLGDRTFISFVNGGSHATPSAKSRRTTRQQSVRRRLSL
jgi:hypothetical protein